jgi:cytochrome b subunit of formate dehydrogenase
MKGSEIELQSMHPKKKNSNVIKKIGRIIVKNKHHYRVNGKYNEGAVRMLNLLERKMIEKNAKDMIDGFNTEHLKALFEDCSK